MSFDIFDVAPHISDVLARPGASVTVHNVRLVDVQRAGDGHELLTIEHAGTTRELIGGGLWNQEYSRRNVGKFGYTVSAQPFNRELPAGACYFRDYIDQSLRRVPELDSSDRANSDDGRALEVVGWRCDARPHGFRVPIGIIPGEAGRFVPDETVAVTLRIPPEFVRECRRVQMTPKELLCSFVGDLAGIQNFAAYPRADRYGSNGSDEREYAGAWLHRAHAMNAIDLDALEAQEDEAQERQFQCDDFSALLDDFESRGGKAADLFAAIQVFVDKQTEAEGD
jgi:hypothetical protein